MHIGNFGLIKVLVVSISFALAICFVGCGDDSSSGAANGDDSKTELNSNADADTADVSGDIDDADVSSSSEDDEDEEVSSDSDDEEEDDDAEEAESSSSSAKKGKSSSSKAKSKSSSSKSKPSSSEDSEEPDDPEDSGEEPAKPESSSSEKEEYPDLSVLSNPNLEQGCDIDKNDDIWVIPSQFMEAEKTVYIWKGDMYSVSSVLELDLKLPMLCEQALGTMDSTLSSDEAGKDLSIQKTCDEKGVLRTWSSAPFQKGDREAVFVNATILCRDDLLD
jgi:hypothetical protein